LLHQEFDAAIGDITITSNRSRYVDFTLPFSDMGVGTLTRNAKKSMWIFLDPLSADLWLTSAGFFFVLGFVIWFIEQPINEEFQGSTRQQIGTALWFSFSTLVYAHRKLSKSYDLNSVYVKKTPMLIKIYSKNDVKVLKQEKSCRVTYQDLW